ncbi:MAG: nucleoside-diphosphate kinase [Candidatus Aenigmatarchaeota archaeon]
MIERTLVIIKPDSIERHLEDKIIKYYTDAGLKIAKKKTVSVSEKLIEKHYPDSMAFGLGEKSKKAGTKLNSDKEIFEMGKKVLQWLRKYLMSGPVVAVILEGDDAIQRVRKITGYTDPSVADKGTIRGDLGNDSILRANGEGRPVRNLIHASGTPEEAEQEIKLWFPELKA